MAETTEVLDLQNRVRAIELRSQLGTGPSGRFRNFEYEQSIPLAENAKVLATLPQAGVTTVVIGWGIPDNTEVETFEIWVKDISNQASGIVKLAECREPPATLTLTSDASTAKTIFIRTRMRSGVGSELSASPTVTADITVPSTTPGPNSVTNTMLQRSGADPISMGTVDIQNAAITNAKIQSLEAGKITAGTLVAGVIYAGTINATQINAGTLNSVNVNAGTYSLTSGANLMQINGTSGFIQINTAGNMATQLTNGNLTIKRNSDGQFALVLGGLASPSTQGSLTLYGNGGSRVFLGTIGVGHGQIQVNNNSSVNEVQIKASAVDNLANSIIVNNSSGSQRINMGVASSGNASSLTLITNAGFTEAITLQCSTTAGVRGVYIDGNRVLGQRGAAVTAISDTADAAYSANEVTMLGNLKTAVNAIISRLQAHGLIS